MNNRPAPTPDTIRDCGECQLCSKKPLCAWMFGYGNFRDQPNQSLVIVNLGSFFDRDWVVVKEIRDNGIRSGKDIIMDVAIKQNLPIIVIRNKEGETFSDLNYLILTENQKSGINHLIGQSIGFLDNSQRMEIFRFRVKENKSK
jgi:hypothetical protein